MEQIRVSTFAGPGAQPVIHTVPRPKISSKAALIKIGACGVCGTDLHILKGHWPKQLPWPFTLGHELGGVIVEVGNEFKTDFMEQAAGGGIEGDDSAADAVRTAAITASTIRKAPTSALPRCTTAATSASTSRRIFGAAGRNTSMWISKCCRARRSTNCPTTCRCGSAHCPSP